jgi:SAM-dependent methyltransferase
VKTGSYRPGDGATLAGELDRLEAQAALSWPEELRVLTELGIRDGDAITDAGCGSGAFTARLRAALPTSPLTAIDGDERLLTQARRRFSEPVGLSFMVGDLADPPVPNASQDALVSRFVFQHLPDPLGVATRLRRLLRPGGLLAVIEVDAGLWGTAEPDLRSGYQEAYRAMAADQAGDGGDRFIARRLPGLLEEAGYRDILVRPYAYGGGITAELAAQLSPERFLPLVERGRLSLGAYARAWMAWEQFRSCGGRVMLLGFVISGRG